MFTTAELEAVRQGGKFMHGLKQSIREARALQAVSDFIQTA